jgi:hypothetical protein
MDSRNLSKKDAPIKTPFSNTVTTKNISWSYAAKIGDEAA